MCLSEIAEELWLAADNNTPPSEELEAERKRDSKATSSFMFIDVGTPDDEIEAYSNWLMKSFLELYHQNIRVVLPSGTLMRLSHSFFDYSDQLDPIDYNYYFSFPRKRQERLEIVTFSGSFLHFESMTVFAPVTEGPLWAVSLRSLHGLPLCISETFLPIDKSSLAKIICEKQLARATGSFNDASAKQVSLSLRILEALDSRQIINREAARARFGRGLKTEEWLAVWREVARVRPDVSKPGPKAKRDKS